MGEKGSVKINIFPLEDIPQLCADAAQCQEWELPKCAVLGRKEKSQPLLHVSPLPHGGHNPEVREDFPRVLRFAQGTAFKDGVTRASLWFGHGSQNWTTGWGFRLGRYVSERVYYNLLMTMVKSHDLLNPQYPSS